MGVNQTIIYSASHNQQDSQLKLASVPSGVLNLGGMIW